VHDGHPFQVNKVALIGQAGAGKTSLVEALLSGAHVISRKGRVEDGTTVCDFEPEEQARKSSLSLALAAFEHEGRKLNLLDTPGLPDFVAEAEAALAVADVAVVVVSAAEGVGPHTEALWRLADDLGLPRVVFVNKLDHERADYEGTLAQLRASFGPSIVPLELPIGIGPGLSGIADLLAERALSYDGDGAHPGPIPEALAATEHQVHEELVEGIVVGDDDLVERYLDGLAPSADELAATLSAGVAAGRVVPVLCGSATKDVGVDRLAEVLGGLASHHHKVRVRAGDVELDVEPLVDGEPLARVFKTIVDPFTGRICLLEVLSGTLHPDTVLINARTRAEERLHVLETLLGKRATPVTEAIAGDIVAVPKLHDVRVGDTLAPRGSPVVVEPIHISEPTCQVAIRARTSGDEDKLMGALQRLQEEDPGLRVTRVEETHQLVVSGMGETHLQVALERLATKLHVATDIEELKVPYRQTITVPAAAEGRHKKQTGGHGQFGVVHLRIEPLERGAGFVFVDEVVGGAIPRQFIPAVEKGVRRAMAQGGDLGYPVVDVKVTVDDGKAHPVDSSEASFEQAGALAFNEALRLAEPCALEPISRVEVIVPAAYLGDVLGDLNGRRGRVLSSGGDEHGDQRVVAMVPTSELTRYGIDLRALTAGRGRFRTEHDHYEPVPARILERRA
jgi:elongation factor G